MNIVMNSSRSSFSELSQTLTKKLDKATKKAHGIYMTPRSIGKQLVETCIRHGFGEPGDRPLHILEPSCGSCELVHLVDDQFGHVHIDAVELNPIIVEEIQKISFRNPVQIREGNFLQMDLPETHYDLIIGNPPYVVCHKDDVPPSFRSTIRGRPNLFCLFLLRSLQLLRPGGLLAFVIPRSFLNAASYSFVRQEIVRQCHILAVDDYQTHNDFLETEQGTIGLVIRKKHFDRNIPIDHECPFSVQLHDTLVFSPDASRLRSLLSSSTTIMNLGLNVRTGSIVWNEHKTELTSDPTDTLLLYNSNLTDQNTTELTQFKNGDKGQYIRRLGSKDPVLVVNRGNGNSAYSFRYSLVRGDRPFLVENHLNVVGPSAPMEHHSLLGLYERVIRSFRDPRTHEFIAFFFGNNGMSKTELETMLPIYLTES